MQILKYLCFKNIPFLDNIKKIKLFFVDANKIFKSYLNIKAK